MSTPVGVMRTDDLGLLVSDDLLLSASPGYALLDGDRVRLFGTWYVRVALIAMGGAVWWKLEEDHGEDAAVPAVRAGAHADVPAVERDAGLGVGDLPVQRPPGAADPRGDRQAVVPAGGAGAGRVVTMDESQKASVRLAVMALREFLDRCEREATPTLVHYRGGCVITPGIRAAAFTLDLVRLAKDLEEVAG
jgi:hypothetical protein